MIGWFNNYMSISTNFGSAKITSSKLNKYKNNFVFMNEFTRNVLDALNRYYIDGLPDTCSQRVILESLLWYGCVFFFEKSGNVIALPGMPDGSGINIYADYAGAFVYGANGFNERIRVYLPGSMDSNLVKKTISNVGGSGPFGVMVRENKLLYPFINQVFYYSEMMADLLRKIETASKNIATPYIVTAEESVIDTVKSFFKHRDNNDPVIMSSGIFPADKIQLLPFDIQSDSIRTLSATYDWVSSHYRELLAVNNTTNIDKKGENLISSEVNINNEYTQNQANSIKNTLEEGLDDVNKIFGLDLHLVIREEVKENDIQGTGQQQYRVIPGSNSSDSSSNDT